MPKSELVRQAYTPATMILPNDEIDVLGLLRVLWRRKVFILLSTGALIAVGAAGIFSISPRYTAEAMVAVGSQGPSAIDLETVSGNLHLDRSDPEAVVTEVEVLSARSLAKQVVGQLNLMDSPEFAAEARAATHPSGPTKIAEDWLRKVGIMPAIEAPVPQATEEAAVLDAFEARRRVAAKGTSRVITVSFTAHDPALAAAVANAIVRTYINRQIENKAVFIKTAGQWLEQRVDSLRTQANLATLEVEQYRSKYGLFVDANGQTPESRELEQRTAQLLQAQAEASSSRARVEQVRGLLASGAQADTMAEVLGSPLIQILQQRANDLQTQIAEMSSKFGSAAPPLQMARAGLADVHAKIKVEVNKLLQQLQNEAAISANKAAVAARAVDELKQRVGEIAIRKLALRRLEEKASGAQTILANFMSRFKQFSPDENQALQQPDARIISGADVPTRVSYPNTKLMALLVVVLALCASALATLAVEAIDRRRLRSGADIETRIGLPVFGLVPIAPRVNVPDQAIVRWK
jgi:polysaccharide biosynthesis transport protein